MKISKWAPGLYTALVSSALAVATAICYGVIFSGISYKEPVFDMKICVLLAVVGVASVVLLLVNERTAGFAPALLCLGSGIAFLMFIKMVIWPISDTIVGIEPFPQFAQIIVCAVLLMVTLILSEAALYMKKYKP